LTNKENGIMINVQAVTANNSIIKRLVNQDKLNDNVMIYINDLSIEDLIAVKLELSATNINNRLYGFDIWHKTTNIVKEALLKFAISTTKSKKDAARFLGLTYSEFKRVLKVYNGDI
jgi:hypothetical protein